MKTANDALIAYSRKYPELNSLIQKFYFDKGIGLPNWHDNVFLPLAAWYSIVSNGGSMAFDKVRDVGELAAVGTWQYSKSVYEFDPDIYDSIVDAGISGNIPDDILFRLPEWCVYIKTPNLMFSDGDIIGFFAYLEDDVNTHKMELRIVLHCFDALHSIPILLNNTSIESSIDTLNRNVGIEPKIQDNDLKNLLKKIVPLVLYLCTDAPEFKSSSVDQPKNSTPTKTKKGLRLFPIEKSRTWKVGHEIGETIRTAHTRAGGKKAPHLRRAHWHHFWIGKRESNERKISCRFLPPIFVGD